METFFMNTKNSKTSEPNRFKYDLIDKLDLRNPNQNMALANLSIYYTWKNVKLTYNNNNQFQAPAWNETFDLPDGSYNISEIQDYIEYIIKKHETIGENAPILIENVEVVLVHCNLVFLKTMNTDFSEKETWFTDQNNNALEIEDNVNISLMINTS